MSGTVWVEVEIKKLTDGAALVENGNGEAWIPRSMIQDHTVEHGDELAEGAELEIEIAEWKAIETGLV